MGRLRKLEQKKERESARISDGFSQGMSLSEGLVVGADGLAAAFDAGSHGVVIPWKGNPHIKIRISSD